MKKSKKRVSMTRSGRIPSLYCWHFFLPFILKIWAVFHSFSDAFYQVLFNTRYMFLTICVPFCHGVRGHIKHSLDPLDPIWLSLFKAVHTSICSWCIWKNRIRSKNHCWFQPCKCNCRGAKGDLRWSSVHLLVFKSQTTFSH